MEQSLACSAEALDVSGPGTPVLEEVIGMAPKRRSRLQQKLAESMEQGISITTLLAQERRKLRIQSGRDAAAVGLYLQHLAEQTDPPAPEDVQTVVRLLRAVREDDPLVLPVSERCLMPLEHVCDRFLGSSIPDEKDGAEVLLDAIGCLARYSSPRAAEFVVRAARRPVAPQSHLWCPLFYELRVNPENVVNVFASLTNPFPVEDISKYLLEAANEAMEELGLPKHPFDFPEGHRLLEKWLLQCLQVDRDPTGLYLTQVDLEIEDHFPDRLLLQCVREAANYMPKSVYEHLRSIGESVWYLDEDDVDDLEDELESDTEASDGQHIVVDGEEQLRLFGPPAVEPSDDEGMDEGMDETIRKVLEFVDRLEGFAALDRRFRRAVFDLLVRSSLVDNLMFGYGEVADCRMIEWPPLFQKKPMCLLRFLNCWLERKPVETLIVAGCDCPGPIWGKRGQFFFEDIYGYQAFVDMLYHGQLVELPYDGTDTHQYLDRLQREWTGPQPQEVAPRVVVRVLAGRPTTEWLVFSATIDGQPGVLIINGAESAWCPTKPDPKCPSTLSFLQMLMWRMHVGRQLVGLGIRPDCYQPSRAGTPDSTAAEPGRGQRR